MRSTPPSFVYTAIKYNANGNTLAPDTSEGVKSRIEGGSTYTQTFDIHNRLATVTVGGQTTEFLYDPDGNLVTKINPDGSKTIYVGGIYEEDKTSGGLVQETKTYYPAAGAMRINNDLYYILKDYLGSASVVTYGFGSPSQLGTIVPGADVRYLPFGETRFTTGTMFTDKLYTGQREMADLGIYHYGARFYSPKLGKFLSPDTIIPNPVNPQSLNRFSYVTNNPLRYTDPTGHRPCEDFGGSCLSENQVTGIYKNKIEKYKVASKIRKKFKNVTIKDPSTWQLQDLNEIYYGLFQINGIRGFDGNTNAMSTAFGNVTFISSYFPGDQVGAANWSTGIIKLEPDATSDTVIHEMGHIFDGSRKRSNDQASLRSTLFANVFDAGFGATDYGRTNSVEDFADSFLAVIKYGSSSGDVISESRVMVITALIQSYTGEVG